MCNVFRNIPRREGDIAEEGQWKRVVELRLQFIIALAVAPLTPSTGGRGVVNGKGKGGGKQLEVRSQRSDSCETGGKFPPQRGDDTNASARLLVIGYTSSKARKVL